MAANSDLPRIEVNRQFQRSIQLDADFERADALSGYICQPSALNALSVVAKHVNDSQQRAFTWTGPYGGGKSTLALALAQLAGGKPAIRQRARQALKIEAGDQINLAFGKGKPWLVLPVVGRRQAAEESIGQAIDRYASSRGRKPARGGRRDVVAELVKRAENGVHGGVLLILDELGKLFEAAARAGQDIHLFQELAEAASRVRGNLVVVGVLHQAFEQYAARSGRETQVEWAKVQGRFVDIPLVAGTDEVLELIGGAVRCEEPHPHSREVSKRIAASIQQRRPASPANLADALDRCWPLHPITAALLGPSSRRRFGQNERSVFGFLNSAEPMGFREFLAGLSRKSITTYDPARYWDYLRVNFEPAILASADGHRWAVTAEAIERVEARFQEPHVSLVKTIGLIELFRNGSGVAASTEVLGDSLSHYSTAAITQALAELSQASIVIYRKHLQAWGIFAGSDFDIDAAVDAIKRTHAPSLEEQLKRLAVLPPITARKHYSDTGTLRWFERMVSTPENGSALAAQGGKGKAGRFILLVPDADTAPGQIDDIAKNLAKTSDSLDLFGAPKGHHRLAEFAGELAALEYVAAHNPALDGDSVARREIHARLEQLRADLESALREAFTQATWYWGAHTFHPKPEDGLFPIASQVCAKVFHHAPRIISELVNRDSLSSNAAKAQRLLMHRMITHGHLPGLGFESFPAEAGLYHATIAALGLHITHAKQGRFVTPEKSEADASILPLWSAWREALASSPGAVFLPELEALAAQPPYGVKRGVLPILLLAFLLVHRSEIAVYIDDVFAPELSEADIDEWLQDLGRVSWKWMRMDTRAKQLLSKLAGRLEEVACRTVTADPLDSARALVSLAYALPPWTQRTTHLSSPARQALTLFLRASDPIKVIFNDIPEVLQTEGNAEALVLGVSKIVEELEAAYPAALQRIHEKLMSHIDHHGNLARLHTRAIAVQGISGDLRLDAFTARLMTYDASVPAIESLISLAVNKPPGEFNDHDFDLATLQLARWAFDFRRTEALASVQGRPANRRAVAVVFAGQDTRSATLDVSEADAGQIQQLRDDLLARVRGGSIKPEVFLAALAEAGSIMLDDRKETING